MPSLMNAPLHYEELDVLLDFFSASPARVSYDGCLGMLTALASIPEVVSPTAWLPAVGPASQAEAEIITALLLRLYNWCLTAVGVETELAAICPGPSNDRKIADFWGGYAWVTATFHDASKDPADVRVGFMIVAHLSRLLDENKGERNELPRDLRNIAERLRRNAAVLVTHIYEGLRPAREARVGELRSRAYTPGQNDPCPCGSGRKRERCGGRR